MDATEETGEDLDLDGLPIDKTVWWKWTAPASGRFSFAHMQPGSEASPLNRSGISTGGL